MPRRYTDEQVEEMMVPVLVKAIYPVLIPVEQQDMRTQQRNHDRMTALATGLWRSFQEISQPCPPHKEVKKSEGDTRYCVECEKCGAVLRELPIA